MTTVYTPDDAFQKMAFIESMNAYRELVRQADADPQAYWDKLAQQYIDWFRPYQTVLDESRAPCYSWFTAGKLNASYLCLDRHIAEKGDQTALIYEDESGHVKSYSYQKLLDQVCQFANLLKTRFQIEKGDRVVLYMPMIPEAIMAMLACARIGAIHVVVFGGFSAEVLKERVLDTTAKLIITADGASRHGRPYLLKPIVDEALGTLSVQPAVLVIEHNHEKIKYTKGRDINYNRSVAKQPTICQPEIMDSEDPLFILHTSGSTGKPKGIVHSTAGYMLWAQWTTKHVFDVHDNDIYWCTADIGWITGHTYVTYGPLALGRTVVIYEGVPTYPDTGRWWSIIEKHRVTQFYTAPTAIRLLHKTGGQEPNRYDLSSLKVLGTVGEPIDPEAWKWYYSVVGRKHCPVIDTWWQTENGGHLIAPLPGATPIKPGSATFPLPGIAAEILTDQGGPVGPGEKGLLCITKPWPSMLRGVWGSPERYAKTYFTTVKKDGKPVYFSGDGAYYDEDGYIVVTGRVDDVINISGHRVGTAEIESVIAEHPLVAESGVVGIPDSLRGERIVSFIVLKTTVQTLNETVLLEEINHLLRLKISAMIKASSVMIVPGLPKTRSGKILRRILRGLAQYEPLTADISTLENPEIVEQIQSLLTHKD